MYAYMETNLEHLIYDNFPYLIVRETKANTEECT